MGLGNDQKSRLHLMWNFLKLKITKGHLSTLQLDSTRITTPLFFLSNLTFRVTELSGVKNTSLHFFGGGASDKTASSTITSGRYVVRTDRQHMFI